MTTSHPPVPAGHGTDRRALGRFGEEEAARYLQLQGLVVIARNWRCREGEIDIVALDDCADCLVVVEVKARSSAAFGSPIEAVTAVKARRLRILAARWLADHPLAVARVRIDVIGVLVRSGEQVELEHVRDAA